MTRSPFLRSFLSPYFPYYGGRGIAASFIVCTGGYLSDGQISFFSVLIYIRDLRRSAIGNGLPVSTVSQRLTLADFNLEMLL